MSASDIDLAAYPHGRVPRRIRETQILALGEQLFAERGFDGVTMDELAARAGVTKPVVYTVVRSKDELYTRCFQRAANELADTVSTAALTNLGDLEALTYAANLAFFRFIETHASAFAMLFAEHAGGRHAATVRQMRGRQVRLLLDVLRQQAARTGSQIDLERAEMSVHAVGGAAEALAHWWRSHPQASAEDLASALTALVLPGLREVVGAPA